MCLPSAGAARFAVSLSQRGLSPPRARAPLPERGGQMRSLGEKNVSARTIPFSPPARRSLQSPARSFLLRAPARAAPLAPRVSFSATPVSALSSHYSPAAGGQEVIRDRPVAASTLQARCGRWARAGRGARRGGLTARSPRPRRGGGEGRRGEAEEGVEREETREGVVSSGRTPAGGGGCRETLPRLLPRGLGVTG